MAAMDHVLHLAETIGARGSTTPQEAEAARYAAQVLHRAGLEPITETFRSARSAWYPSALFCGLTLLAVMTFWVGGRPGAIGALGLALLATVSILLELAFRPNPLRWILPKSPSQNVYAQAPPRSTTVPATHVVLLGHLDSHRTPLAFSSDSSVAGRAFHNIARRLLGEDVPFVTLREPGMLERIFRLVRPEGD